MNEITLTHVLPVGEWAALERDVHSRFGLNASVFDIQGNRITGYQNWANTLCPVVKANRNGQQYICGLAHQNVAQEANRLRSTAIKECDAGLVKLVVPMFIDGTFLGVVGGCGLLRPSSEVETSLVSMTTGIREEEIEKLAESIKTIDDHRLKGAAAYVEEWICRIIGDYDSRRVRTAALGL